MGYLDDVNGMAALGHARERLCVAIHSLELVEVLDLATLSKGNSEIDFINDTYDTTPVSDHHSTMAMLYDTATPPVQGKDNTTLLAFFGDGYLHVSGAPPLPSFYAGETDGAVDAADLRRIENNEGDSQDAAPFTEGSRFVLAVEHAAPAHIALDPNNSVVYYTSGGHYISNSQAGTLGATVDLRATLIKRFDIDSNTQLSDLATVPLAPAKNQGLRGLAVLPVGHGVLVCNGSRVDWVTLAGDVARSYSPQPENLAQSLIACAVTADGNSFWVLDEDSTWLFRFDIRSGNMTASFPTYLPPGGATQIALYQPDGIADPCW